MRDRWLDAAFFGVLFALGLGCWFTVDPTYHPRASLVLLVVVIVQCVFFARALYRALTGGDRE